MREEAIEAMAKAIGDHTMSRIENQLSLRSYATAALDALLDVLGEQVYSKVSVAKLLAVLRRGSE